MEIEYRSWYDQDYWTQKKTYQTPDGRTEQYHGPALAWDGFNLVADALAAILPKGTLLDIGCGGGDLAHKLLKRGYDSYGIDISEYALSRTNEEMKHRVALNDISTCPKKLHAYRHQEVAFPDQFDAVISCDLLEHLYQDDLEPTFKWMVEKAKSWLFFCVAVVDDYKTEFIHEKGKPVPVEWQGAAVSGHVHVRYWPWWAKFFKNQGLTVRWDLMYIFQLFRERNKGWKDTGGWNMPSTWCLQKK